jgi:hypothetical protein
MARELELSQGLVALVDDADFDQVGQFKWSAHRTKYAIYACTRTPRGNGPRKTILLHRFLMKPPEGFVVDHISGNGLDNTRANLRVVPMRDNCRNRRRDVNCVTAFKGVHFDKKYGKWIAAINVGNRRYYGKFRSTAEEAARDYDDLARTHFGEFGRYNFPLDGERAA